MSGVDFEDELLAAVVLESLHQDVLERRPILRCDRAEALLMSTVQ
jgi:hypothetical protein